MIVLGVDPGMAAVGFGVVSSGRNALRCLDYGCIRTYPEQSTAERLLVLYRGIVEMIEKNRPDRVAVEQLFFAKNAKTALAVGQARGVVILAAASMGVDVAEYTPLEVKSAVTGYGRAAKEQVQAMVQRILLLPVAPWPDDAADALAVAICCINSSEMENRVARPCGK